VRTSSIFGFSLCSLLALACDVSQELGPPKGHTGGGGDAGGLPHGDGAGGGGGTDFQPSQPASGFEWLNPKPHGNGFRAVAATSDANVWLGGRGEVVSWNGQTWTTHTPSTGDVLYHALWARGEGDVWAGGTRVDWGEDEVAVLVHFDGSKWAPNRAFEHRDLIALAGSAEGGYLALDGGEIRTLAGQTWQIDGTFPGRRLRALFARGAGHAFAVGESGFLARRTASGWAAAAPEEEGAGAPFGANRHYIGVWASSPDDAWAVFETLLFEDGNACSPSEIGFTHWNGSTWSVVQQAPADCGLSVPDLEPTLGCAAFSAHGTAETRRGALIAGRSANDVVASVGNGQCLWHYDGSAFSPIVQSYALASSAAWPPTWRLHSLLGAAPAVAATPSSTFIGGSGGQLVSYDATKSFPVPQQPLPWPSTNAGMSPALKQAFVADRSPLIDMNVTDHAVVGVFANRPSTWSLNGWVPLLGPAGSLDPQELLSAFSVLHPDGEDALWALGRNGDVATAVRWDGVEWSAVEVEPLGADNIYVGSMTAWNPPGSSRVWFTAGSELRRFDGERFVNVALPIPADHPYVWTLGGIGGTSENDVWVSATVDVATSSQTQDVRRLLFHDDGSGFELVHDAGVDAFYAYNGPHVLAFAPDQVLVIERHPHAFAPSDPTGLLWNGEKFTELALPVTNAEVQRIWGRAANDLYLLAYVSTDGAYLFHHDGTGWTQIFAADQLTTLTGDAKSLWLGGDNGATVRATLPPAVPTPD
jgi:hypothetical protein